MDWGFSFEVGPPSYLEGVLYLPLNKTLSCNWAVTLVHHFKSLLWCDRTKEMTRPWHIWCHLLDLTYLKQPWLGPSKAETKHKSPTQISSCCRRWTQRKPKHSGSDKKPRVLETGTTKTNSAESSHCSVSDSRRPPVRVGGPCPCGWKDIRLTKSSLLYNLLLLVSSNLLCTGEWQSVQLSDLAGTAPQCVPRRLHYQLRPSDCCPSGLFSP